MRLMMQYTCRPALVAGGGSSAGTHPHCRKALQLSCWQGACERLDSFSKACLQCRVQAVAMAGCKCPSKMTQAAGHAPMKPCWQLLYLGWTAGAREQQIGSNEVPAPAVIVDDEALMGSRHQAGTEQ